MTNGNGGQNPHFILEGVTETEAYRYPGGGGGDRPDIPERDRPSHAAALRGQLAEVRVSAEAAAAAQRHAGMDDGLGLQVEFESFPELELAFESLARDNQGIELHNVRHDNDVTRATVFVPDGKLDHFENLIVAYLERRKNKLGHANDHRRLLDVRLTHLKPPLDPTATTLATRSPKTSNQSNVRLGTKNWMHSSTTPARVVAAMARMAGTGTRRP